MLFRLFWGSLGLVLGAFGGFLEALFVFFRVRGGHPNFQNLFFYTLSSHLGPRGARKSPKQLPGRPHGEGDGPTKPPWSRFPAFLRVIVSPGGLITRKNAGIVALALHESQMGGLNHT